MAQHKIYINNRIDSNDSRISRAITAITNASPSDKILIYFNQNNGGAIQDAVSLIDAIESSNPSVQIILIFKNYAISAAAYIMCYFAFYNVVSPNVSVQLDGSVCVVYHKPRVMTKMFTYFASGLYHDRNYPPEIDFMKQITPFFDVVFQSMFDACYKKDIRIAPHMKSVYNMNGDVSVTFSGGPLNA
jgi:hypothetical protein